MTKPETDEYEVLSAADKEGQVRARLQAAESEHYRLSIEREVASAKGDEESVTQVQTQIDEQAKIMERLQALHAEVEKEVKAQSGGTD